MIGPTYIYISCFPETTGEICFLEIVRKQTQYNKNSCFPEKQDYLSQHNYFIKLIRLLHAHCSVVMYLSSDTLLSSTLYLFTKSY